MSHNLAQLLRVASFAAEKHRSQCRKDKEASPYINHPLAVAELLASHGDISEISLLAAALLHDTVEDTATSFQEIADRFGDEVCQLVAEVTDDKQLPKLERKRLQVENAPHKSHLAKQLKIADKICNIRDINGESPIGWDRNRKLEYLDWAEQVVAGCRGVNNKLDQLFDQTVAQTRQSIS